MQLPKTDYYVCVECGKRQNRLIKKLLDSNYMLEKCDRCGLICDKYLEFEVSFKILCLILCY